MEKYRDALSGKLLLILSHDERFISNALKSSVNDMANTTTMVEVSSSCNWYFDTKLYTI